LALTKCRGEAADIFASAVLQRIVADIGDAHLHAELSAKRTAASPMPEAPYLITATLSLTIAGWSITSSPRFAPMHEPASEVFVSPVHRNGKAYSSLG